MTDEEFFSALQVEGLPKEDCKILKGLCNNVGTCIKILRLIHASTNPQPTHPSLPYCPHNYAQLENNVS